MPADRAGLDGDHAEAIGARQGGEHAAFGDAEDRARGCLAADMQAGIGIAGDDEGIRRILRDDPRQRQRHALGVLLALDAERSLAQGAADDLRAVSKGQRLKRLREPVGDGLVGIGVDDENACASAHLLFLLSGVETCGRKLSSRTKAQGIYAPCRTLPTISSSATRFSPARPAASRPISPCRASASPRSAMVWVAASARSTRAGALSRPAVSTAMRISSSSPAAV